MVFSSLVFLFLFFPLFFTLYYSFPNRFRNYIALAGSLLFYAWGAPRIVFLLIIASLSDYIISILMKRLDDNPTYRKYLLTFSICVNVSLLGYFKYANFFVHEFNKLMAAIGVGSIPWMEVALPVGISFFTFHKISYVVDVYRRVTKPASNFPDYLLYMVLFPQLIAGPIIRYHDIYEQIENRAHSLDNFFEGLFRFILGLGKKVLIANVLGEVSDKIFNLDPASVPVTYAWLGAICYSFQIYFDFSGYSDMAIGLGRMMGFHFLENFNMPYISRNITEFWLRWHISLSSWMREYLYIPLGGNRVSDFQKYVNLWIVFLVSGIWHGANWTFLLWGAYHGLFLSLDKLFWQARSLMMNKILSITITYIMIVFSWVIFRSPDAGYAWKYSLRMLGLTHYAPSTSIIIWEDLLTNRGLFILCLAAVISFLPAFNLYDRFRERIVAATAGIVLDGTRFAFFTFVAIFSILALSNAKFNPFIYFRF